MISLRALVRDRIGLTVQFDLSKWLMTFQLPIVSVMVEKNIIRNDEAERLFV